MHLRYKDYRDHDRNKVMVLEGEELIRRFLLHILPTGFMRIRHYGFLANRCRRQKLTQIRQSLQAIAERETVGQTAINHPPVTVPAVIEKPRPCPQCKTGRLIVVGEIAPKRLDYG